MSVRVNDFVGVPFKERSSDLPRSGDCLGAWRFLLEQEHGRPFNDDPWSKLWSAAIDGDGVQSEHIPDCWEPVPIMRADRLCGIVTGQKAGNHLVIVGEDGWALNFVRDARSNLISLAEARRIARSAWRWKP